MMISIIIPTKNAAESLQTCLSSIKRQTYKKLEIIVVDNYSKDKTVETAKKFTKKVFQKGPERSAQRNFGVQKSQGDMVIWLDADMELSPKVIEECVIVLKKHTEIQALIIPERSRGRGFWAKCRALEKECYLGDDQMEAVRFVRKWVFNKVGKMSENFVSGEDWDITTRIRQNGYKIGRINSYIVHNEGNLNLIENLNKKFYYATKSLPFIETHVKASKDVLTFIFRPSFIRNWRLLAKDPIHALGLFFMKSMEFGVGAIGVIIAKINSTHQYEKG